MYGADCGKKKSDKRFAENPFVQIHLLAIKAKAKPMTTTEAQSPPSMKITRANKSESGAVSNISHDGAVNIL